MKITKVGVLGTSAATLRLVEAMKAGGVAVIHLTSRRPEPRSSDAGLAAFGEVDLAVVEVGDEAEEVGATLGELDVSIPGRALRALVSATHSVSDLAAQTSRPGLTAGLNLPYSDPKSRLVEIVRGETTSRATVASLFAFAQAVRLSPIVCADIPGRVVGRIEAAARAGRGDGEDQAERASLAALVEACALVEAGASTVREVDAAMAAAGDDGPGPPFARADEAGLTPLLDRLESLRAELGDDRFTPPPLLRRLISQRRLGPASGQGFYPSPRPDPGPQRETVKVETRGEVTVLWMDHHPVNAISMAVVEDLADAWERTVAAGARAVVIASASPLVFSAGGDLKAFKGLDATSGRALIDRVHEVFQGFWTGGTPTVAAINGLALGGGCELGMACDFRVAARSSYFSLPEASIGTAPSFGATVRLPRLVGEARALEMIALAQVVLADEACAAGLVNAVVPDHELFDEALALARELAAQPPLAIAQMKRALRKGDVGREIDAEKAGFVRLVVSEDAREGLAAFLERREPVWAGR